MSTQRHQSVTALNRQNKIQKLMDDPHLPALVETLPAQSLSELIDQVGIENNHAVVMHASNEQIKGVLDIQLWRGSPGKQETLNPDDFFPWLESWNELGANFVSDKLEGLGEEFLALCFTKHLVATDITVVGLSAAGHDFGRYDVQPKRNIDQADNEAIWYVILDTLQHLHASSPDFLEAVLRRCSFVRSILKEDISEHHVAEDLQVDLCQERDQRAERTGYVAATDAFALLSMSRDATIEEVLARTQYDELSRRHFRLEVSQAGVEPDQDTPESLLDEPSLEGSLQGLKEILGELGITRAGQSSSLLLPGKGARPDSTTRCLDRAMVALQEESVEMFARRRREILYLANVLIAGVGLRGSAFTELNAVRAVRSTCNLGLEYLVQHDFLQVDESYFEFLSQEPGLLRPFHIGFHLLNRVPLTCIEGVTGFLSSKRLISRLRRAPSISAQLDDLLPGEQLIQKVLAGKFEDLKQDIELLALVLDTTSVHCLDHLVDAFPVFPRILRMQPPPVYLDQSIRFISTPQDLDDIQRYVSGLRVDL
jgi:hypothetical protein